MKFMGEFMKTSGRKNRFWVTNFDKSDLYGSSID